MVITGTSILAFGAAILAGIVVGYVAFGFTWLLFWGKDGGERIIYPVAVIAGLLAAWGGWELVYFLTSATISVHTGP